MPKAFLMMQRGQGIGHRYPVKHGQTTMGRNPDNDILVDELAVSRYHAVLRYDEQSGELSIRDLGSTNGVTVNNIELQANAAYRLQQRDTVFIGRAIFNVQFNNEAYNGELPPTAASDPERTRRLNLPQRTKSNTKKLVSYVRSKG